MFMFGFKKKFVNKTNKKKIQFIKKQTVIQLNERPRCMTTKHQMISIFSKSVDYTSVHHHPSSVNTYVLSLSLSLFCFLCRYQNFKSNQPLTAISSSGMEFNQKAKNRMISVNWNKTE